MEWFRRMTGAPGKGESEPRGHGWNAHRDVRTLAVLVMSALVLGCRTPPECKAGMKEARALLSTNQEEEAFEVMRTLFNGGACDSNEEFRTLHDEAGDRMREAKARKAQEAEVQAKAIPPELPACDAHALWFDRHPSRAGNGEPEERRRRFVEIVSHWTEECRENSIGAECLYRCDDFISGMVIEAAATDQERTRLIARRLKGNKESAALGATILVEFRQLAAYAQRIRSSPRSSYYWRSTATLEEQAEQIANGNACLDRYRRDNTKLHALNAKLDEQLQALPVGFTTLSTAVGYLRSCLDCGDSRELCDDVAEVLDGAQETLAELRELIAKDEAALAAILSTAVAVTHNPRPAQTSPGPAGP